jgi:hypothetical protein
VKPCTLSPRTVSHCRDFQNALKPSATSRLDDGARAVDRLHPDDMALMFAAIATW